MRNGALCVLLVLGLSTSSSAARALTYSILDRLCIPDAVAVPRIEKRAPIPIGCELVDCCPGCPATGPLELRVSIDATIVTGAELRFEGLADADLKRLKVSGTAKREGERILLRAGTARITGIPYPSSASGTTAFLQPLIARDAVKRMPSQPAGPGAGGITDHITLQQFRGPFLVNSFNWGFAILPCRKPPKPPTASWDKLKIDGIAAGDEVIVMMDARTGSGCQDGSAGIASEQLFASTGETVHPNLLSPAAGCNSEIAIFSKNHAMKWETAVPWTDNPGDVHTVTLDPLIKAEVNIWVMDDTTAALALTHFNKARDLFRENRVGVLFEPKIRKLPDATAAQTVRNGVDPYSWDCLALDPIKATSSFYTANALNIYYVDMPVGGKNCAIKPTPGACVYDTTAYPPGDANITFLGTAASLTTLAHELGHAYGLRPAKCKGHTEGIPGFASDNLMCTGPSCVNRSKLTLGQVFRMNTYADEGWGGTMLIPNNVPSRVPRLCKPDAPHSAVCPALNLQWP
jgi:hypothetical protein